MKNCAHSRTKRRRRAWARSRRSRRYFTRKAKWTTAWTSRARKRKSHAPPESSASVAASSPSSSREYIIINWSHNQVKFSFHGTIMFRNINKRIIINDSLITCEFCHLSELYLSKLRLRIQYIFSIWVFSSKSKRVFQGIRDAARKPACLHVLPKRQPQRDGHVPGGSDQLFCPARRRHG